MDSLGVQIVEHSAVELESVPQWSLAADPVVSIGVAEGEESYQLFGVIDAERRRDGSIAVVDGSLSLRMFDSQGSHVWTTGRRGDGPGEFSYPQMVTELSGDSLAVWDWVHNRLTVFSRDGAVVRVLTVSYPGGSGPSLGLAAPGLLLNERRAGERTSVNGRPAIVQHSEVVLLDVSTGGTVSLGRELLVEEFEDSDGAWGPAAFDVLAVFAVAAKGYWYGSTRGYEVRRVGASGLEVILRWTGPSRSISEGDFQALINVWVGGEDATAERERGVREYANSIPRAEQFPAYDALLTDSDERLWVRAYTRPTEDPGTKRWIVFSSDGARLVGRFSHPTSLRLLQIGPDWVLGVETDRLGVERIVVRTIVKESARDSTRDQL